MKSKQAMEHLDNLTSDMVREIQYLEKKLNAEDANRLRLLVGLVEERMSYTNIYNLLKNLGQ